MTDDADESQGGDACDPTANEDEDDAATLSVDADDVAGVVDLFGALAPAELRRALGELAFKRDVEEPPTAVVDDAVASYHLVEHDGVLVVGPTAFPTLPDGATDLPHILDVERDAPPTTAVAETVERRFREEAARTLAGGGDAADGPAAVERLVDVSYDLEAWGPVDVGEVRRRLDDARDEGDTDDACNVADSDSAEGDADDDSHEG